jgi:hypothetical protein
MESSPDMVRVSLGITDTCLQFRLNKQDSKLVSNNAPSRVCIKPHITCLQYNSSIGYSL